MTQVDSERLTEQEWRDREDLRKNWEASCQCDPFEGADTFLERMAAAGFIELAPVEDHQLQTAFAGELGIHPGGSVWELTDKGRKVLSYGAPAHPLDLCECGDYREDHLDDGEGTCKFSYAPGGGHHGAAPCDKFRLARSHGEQDRGSNGSEG